ncbi:MAG: UDP-N-acetylglucosamine 2-epimerase (non-hydrolyzing) [Bacteroidetes bacterium]|nr:MAG: UDP-N-acetylglucosamine 2-epimerase (non-hydrolyzing) [Bacteroidota bacterium]
MSRRICTVVGARPQFVKAAVVSDALKETGVTEVLVHTGQHYDAALSAVFFDELGLPTPAVNLGVGSAGHAEQTGAMMVRLDAFLQEEAPFDALLVYGDTNSTLAGALVAAKRSLPLVHVEAGLRSFDRRMPEEVNRIVTDRLADLLLAPTPTAVANLRAEGLTEGVHRVGDVMLDATQRFAERAAERAPLDTLTGHAPGTYVLATVHRAENTDDPERLRQIFDGLGRLDEPVLLPLHPRTRRALGGRPLPPNVELRPPAGYLAMLTLIRHARRVVTDSGGVQKEAYWLGVPCVTLRAETEWVETLHGGWNRLVGADPGALVAAVRQVPQGPRRPFGQAPGGGSPGRCVAERVRDVLERSRPGGGGLQAASLRKARH